MEAFSDKELLEAYAEVSEKLDCFNQFTADVKWEMCEQLSCEANELPIDQIKDLIF